jgi:hypothetical protein
MPITSTTVGHFTTGRERRTLHEIITALEASGRCVDRRLFNYSRTFGVVSGEEVPETEWVFLRVEKSGEVRPSASRIIKRAQELGYVRPRRRAALSLSEVYPQDSIPEKGIVFLAAAVPLPRRNAPEKTRSHYLRLSSNTGREAVSLVRESHWTNQRGPQIFAFCLPSKE